MSRIPEFSAVEADIAAVQARLQALEAKARGNSQLVETVQGLDPISEDTIAVSLKDVQTSMNEVEANSQLSALGQRLAVKVKTS